LDGPLAGQERFRSISASYLRGSSIFVIVYDITDRNSFQMVRDYWASHAKSQANENTMIFLVGNKAGKYYQFYNRYYKLLTEILSMQILRAKGKF
jgi:GTPase SAR1 family protein